MSRLEEVLEAMDLKPGQTVRCWVKGHEVVVRMLVDEESDLVPDEDLYVHIPDPPPLRIVRAKAGPRTLPDPPSTDEVPE